MPEIYIRIFQLIVLYAAMVLHEVSHGMMAYQLGDPTAKMAGRLSLNPLKHIDLFGTVLLPLLLIFAGSPFVFCYAKPVPFNPYNFKNRRKGIILTGLAGPVSNFVLALVFAAVIRILDFAGLLSAPLFFLLVIVVLINLVLAFFNLAPFPPFDGHHLAFSLLPGKFARAKEFLSKHSFILMLVWIVFVFPYLFAPAIYFLTEILIGRVLP